MSLLVENLSFSYGERAVLQGVSFEAQKGEFLSILGPNGVGKSTLFRCILGTLRVREGRICVNGRDVAGLSQRQRARCFAYIPQIHRPTFGYSVLDTVLMGTTRRLSAFQRPGQAQEKLALAALERMGVVRLAQRDFSRLSGGEQQLVLIARAIAQQSDVLIMDEPTSALDYGNQLRVLQQVRALSREGYTVLLSTHNPQHALTFADRVLALQNGAAVALGESKSVLTPELIRRLYGVETVLADTPGGSVLVPLPERTEGR
jgi:iron complex transport system ATP-binding protein